MEEVEGEEKREGKEEQGTMRRVQSNGVGGQGRWRGIRGGGNRREAEGSWRTRRVCEEVEFFAEGTIGGLRRTKCTSVAVHHPAPALPSLLQSRILPASHLRTVTSRISNLAIACAGFLLTQSGSGRDESGGMRTCSKTSVCEGGVKSERA